MMDSDKLAEKLLEASFGALEMPDFRRLLATAERGHPVVDEPELFRWFFIKKFPTSTFGITRSFFDTSHGKWQVDRIIELLKSGEPEWPAFVTADGVIVDGFHRIAAHHALKDKNMSVVVAVLKEPPVYAVWDEMWNEIED